MLDIPLIREKPDYVRERLATRDRDLVRQVDAVLDLDAERRRLETEMQRLSGERNRLSKEIGALRSKKEPSSELESKVRAIGDDIARLGGQVSAADDEQRELLYAIPNLPHPSVPIGTDASANAVIRIWGERPAFDFRPLDHVDLGAKLGLFDLERAAKMSGSGFVYFTNIGARLQRALIQFLLDLHTLDHGYVEMGPPYLVRRRSMIGTGQLPKFEEEAYGLEEGELFLIPTA